MTCSPASGRHLVAISPDGTRLAYVANERLYICGRSISSTPRQSAAPRKEGAPIMPGTRSSRPMGSGLDSGRMDQLKKVSVSGGAPVVLCAAANPWGASWGADGTILFGQGPEGISQVSASGGQASVLVSVDSKTESAHGPQMLPGGKAVLFTLASSTTTAVQPRSDVLGQRSNRGSVARLRASGRSSRRGALTPAMCLPDISLRSAGDAVRRPVRPGRLVTTGIPFPVADASGRQ